jgi:hypothetical protein
MNAAILDHVGHRLFQPGWCGLAYLNSTENSGILRPTCYGSSFEQYFDSEQCVSTTARPLPRKEDENTTVSIDSKDPANSKNRSGSAVFLPIMIVAITMFLSQHWY